MRSMSDFNLAADSLDLVWEEQEAPHLKLVHSADVLNEPDVSLDDEMKSKLRTYLQPFNNTKLSNDFSSQVLAQIIQHFQHDLEHRKIMDPVMKDIVFPKIQNGYRAYIEYLLKRSKHFDENCEKTREYLFSFWSEYIDSLEGELAEISILLENYSFWEEVDNDDELIVEIMRHTNQVLDTYFSTTPLDSENMYG